SAHVVAAAVHFEGEVFFAACEAPEGGGEGVFAVFACGVELAQKIHHRGREYVHAEEAEVITGAQARDDEGLLGLGGGGLFEDVFDFVEVVAARDAGAADRAEIGEHGFAGWDHGG